MFIISDKETGHIIAKLSKKEIIEGNWIKTAAGNLIQLTMVSISETNEVSDKPYYHNGKFRNSSIKEFEIKQMEVMIELSESDSQMIRLVDELMEFCEEMGFKPNTAKKLLVAQRKELRNKLNNL